MMIMAPNPEHSLSYWWRPSQWLRIVWGVWVDQPWYWREVSPRLGGRTRGWGIWFQALFGAILVSLMLCLLLFGTHAVIGRTVYPGSLLGVSFLFIGVPPLWFVLTLVRGLKEGIPLVCVTLPLLTNHFFWLGQLIRTGENVNELGIFALTIACIGLTWGFMVGLLQGEKDFVFTFFGFIFVGMIIGKSPFVHPFLVWLFYVARGVGGAVWGGLWCYLAMRWATRNLPPTSTIPLQVDSQL
ncbi:MAG: hypothetical protein H0T73_16920 [Ardenticatenales bacterium]|nr:hypothetical protein [Ardenticatenales bacterium]